MWCCLEKNVFMIMLYKLHKVSLSFSTHIIYTHSLVCIFSSLPEFSCIFVYFLVMLFLTFMFIIHYICTRSYPLRLVFRKFDNHNRNIFLHCLVHNTSGPSTTFVLRNKKNFLSYHLIVSS